MSTTALTDTVLVPLDGTATGFAALPWLRAVATGETRLVLLRAVTMTLPVTGFGAMPAETFDQIQRNALAEAHAYLEAVADELAGVTTHVTKLARVGTAADEILASAETHAAGMILMATEGRGAAGRFFIGSVGDRVARAATVPVMLVPARAEPVPDPADRAYCDRLVVPFDGSELARAALPVAATLAGRLEVPVRLIRVVPTADEMVARRAASRTGMLYQRALRAVPTLPQPEVDRAWYEEYVGSVESALAAEAARLATPELEASGEVRIGETVPALLDALTADDIVVMTSHGEGGVRRWLMGSVAEQLIHQAVAPVVLVPSPGRERIGA